MTLEDLTVGNFVMINDMCFIVEKYDKKPELIYLTLVDPHTKNPIQSIRAYPYIHVLKDEECAVWEKLDLIEALKKGLYSIH